MNTNLLNYTRPELTALLASWGYSAYYAELIWSGLYRQQARHVTEIAGLRPDLLAKLQNETEIAHPRPVLTQTSQDGTIKYLLALSDGEQVETVLMPYRDRFTACISTQAGCAMGCIFCATGQMGFVRNLTAGEIVGQVVYLTGDRGRETGEDGGQQAVTGEDGGRQAVTGERGRGTGEDGGRQTADSGNETLRDRKEAAVGIPRSPVSGLRSPVSGLRSAALRNLVFMGMGEPLHNYDATMTAVDILTDQHGPAIAPRHITLSTVGLVPAIRRLADQNRPVHLAVSLHGATDEERNRLVPIGRRWPLAELMAACRYYVQKRGRRIFFEWTLIAGQNDTTEQAHALGRLLAGMDAHVNLIPLNPTGDYAGQPSDPEVARTFQAILGEYGLPSTVRRRKGIDIAAGCGQLRQQKQSENGIKIEV